MYGKILATLLPVIYLKKPTYWEYSEMEDNGYIIKHYFAMKEITAPQSRVIYK